MWGSNRLMIIRLFLSLLALLSGLSAAQAVSPARSAQSAIGASAPLATANVSQAVAARHVVDLRLHVDQPKSVKAQKQARFIAGSLVIEPAPRTYLSDRTRQ
jgi:hypothetical protein